MDLQIIQNKIFEVRGCRVMLDFHLAELYGVQTKALKQAVKRNEKRFLGDFRFTMTKEEWDELVTICDQLPENLKHSYIFPDCFTEQGVDAIQCFTQSDRHRREYFHHACFRPHAANVNWLRGTS